MSPLLMVCNEEGVVDLPISVRGPFGKAILAERSIDGLVVDAASMDQINTAIEVQTTAYAYLDQAIKAEEAHNKQH